MASGTVEAACFTLLCALLATILLKALKRHNAGLNLPPGPWSLPVIGNMHCLLGSLPHHAMRKLSRRYGPVMLLQLGHVPTLVVSSPEAAREVMKTHDVVFASRHLTPTASILTYGAAEIIFAPYDRHFRELRKLCTMELLSPKRVLSYRTIREEETAILVRTIATSPTVVNISERVRVTMNDIIMRVSIGDKCPQREAYLKELDKSVNLLAGFNLVDLFPRSRLARMLGGRSLRATMEVQKKIHLIMDAIIQDRGMAMKSKEPFASPLHGKEDILDVLLRFRSDGGLGITLTSETVNAVLWDVFAAGSETTSTVTIWAMSELMRNPRVMKRAQSEIRQVLQGKSTISGADIEGRIHYLQLVIKETLRLHPPAPLLVPRSCSEPSKIMGYDIPQGTAVFVNVWAIGRDEKNWSDANEFRPERFENEMIDFNGTDFRFLPGGAGRRMCPGLMFGVSNIEMALASLLYHFDWKLPIGENPHGMDMTETYGITARRKAELLLEAMPFVPSSV